MIDVTPLDGVLSNSLNTLINESDLIKAIKDSEETGVANLYSSARVTRYDYLKELYNER